jgi:hypothetical protein
VFDNHTERPLYLGCQTPIATADQRIICYAKDGLLAWRRNRRHRDVYVQKLALTSISGNKLGEQTHGKA